MDARRGRAAPGAGGRHPGRVDPGARSGGAAPAELGRGPLHLRRRRGPVRDPRAARPLRPPQAGLPRRGAGAVLPRGAAHRRPRGRPRRHAPRAGLHRTAHPPRSVRQAGSARRGGEARGPPASPRAAAPGAGAGAGDADGPARLHPGHPCAPRAVLAQRRPRLRRHALRLRHAGGRPPLPDHPALLRRRPGGAPAPPGGRTSPTSSCASWAASPSLAPRSRRSPPRRSGRTTSRWRCGARRWSWTGTCRATRGSWSARPSES